MKGRHKDLLFVEPPPPQRLEVGQVAGVILDRPTPVDPHAKDAGRDLPELLFKPDGSPGEALYYRRKNVLTC